MSSIPIETLNAVVNGATVLMLGRAIRDLRRLTDTVETEAYDRRGRPRGKRSQGEA